jgi:serine protease Do
MRALKAFRIGILVHLLLGVCIAQQDSAQEHDALTQLSQSLQRVITKVAPAVVTLDVAAYSHSEDDEDKSTSTRDRHRFTKAHSTGSGVIVDSNGYIITNAHLVEGARVIRVTLDDMLRASYAYRVGELASITFDGRIVGLFEEADLALVKIDASGLPTISFANSDAVRPGQLVFAVGSPEGFKNSVSMGVVSAVGRDSGMDENASFIQTDAAINPGSSGGALVDTNGNLVGINSFVITDDHGANERLGFALPSKLVRSVFEELKNTGHVTYGEIGVKVQNVTPVMARGLHISQDWGIIVSDVLPGSYAERAGLEIQDLILAIDEQPVFTVPQFIVSLYGRRVGDPVRLELLRGSQRFARTVSVVERSPDLEKLRDPAMVERGLIVKLGVICTPLDQHPSRSGTVRSAFGLIVIGKLAGSDIDIELMPGDVIRSINGTAVTSVEGLRSEIDKLRVGASAVLQIERRHQFQYLPLQID